jgi:hypothetical protein
MSYKLTESDVAALATLAAAHKYFEIVRDGAWRVRIGAHQIVATSLALAINECMRAARPKCPTCGKEI